MKKESKQSKVTKKKNIKKNKTYKKNSDPSIDISIGGLIIATNSFNSEIFLGKLFMFFGLILLIEGTFRQSKIYKKNNQKGLEILMLALFSIFVLTLLILVLGTLFIN